MSARQQFDMTPIRPRWTEIDAIKSWDCVRWAVERAYQLGHGEHEINYELVAWLNFVGGAQTERSLRKPRPRGYISAMPEIWRSAGEIFELRVERLGSKMPEFEEDARPPAPTSLDLDRWEESSRWLRFIHGDCRDRDQKILWLRAQGVGYPALSRQFGLPAKACSNIKSTQLERIASRLAGQLDKQGLRLRDIL